MAATRPVPHAAQRQLQMVNAARMQAVRDATAVAAVAADVSAVQADVGTINSTIGDIDGRLVLVEDEVFP